MLHVIVNAMIAAFVSAFKWISLAFERGWVTKYVGVIRKNQLDSKKVNTTTFSVHLKFGFLVRFFLLESGNFSASSCLELL